jgi:hypothetical protein
MAKRSTRSVRVKGASSADEQTIKAAKQAARNGDTGKATVADVVRVENEQHTRLAKPGEGPETQEKSFEPKVRLGADNETHTRLATPQDPEAKAQMKEVAKVDKATGRKGPVEVVQKGENTPEAQPTPKEKRAAAQKLFEKADEAGQADIIRETQVRGAALGGGF